jgi:hypothetical protein
MRAPTVDQQELEKPLGRAAAPALNGDAVTTQLEATEAADLEVGGPEEVASGRARALRQAVGE